MLSRKDLKNRANVVVTLRCFEVIYVTVYCFTPQTFGSFGEDEILKDFRDAGSVFHRDNWHKK